MSDPNRVVVIGGGTAGAAVTNKLAKKLKKTKQPFEITIIDPTFNHVYQPGFLFTMFGRDETKNIIKDTRTLIPKSVNAVQAAVTKVDTEKKVIFTDNKDEIPYDYVVLASGARIATDRVDWWDDSIYHFYSPPAAEKLYEQLKDFKEGRILIAIGDLPYRCPPAPLEAAFLIDDWMKKQGRRDKVEIKYASPLNRAFSIENVNKVVEPLFEKKDILLETYFNVDDVDTEERVVYSLEGSDDDYDLLVMIPPHAAQQYIVDSGIAEGAGWVPTDKVTLRVEGQENMYALGDTTDIPTSKAGSTAHYQAPIVAKNIANDILGNGKTEEYDGHVQCFFLTEFGKSLFIDFNYENPPKYDGFWGWFLLRPRKAWWWFKQIFKPFYFRMVARGHV